MKKTAEAVLMGIRITGPDQNYWKGKLVDFARLQGCRVEFGLQDSRGTPSISWKGEKGVTTKQLHFKNKDMMLGYVQGYLQGDSDFN